MRENKRVQTRFLLGPAGSGKTFRCLKEIRAALQRSPEGAPLVLLAPKQATFQLERQLLDDPGLHGYTRLQILSFDRLANFILDHFSLTRPELLSDEGRLMVLRALLARNQSGLQVFRATARLPGFAQQLSLVLREFQRHQIGPAHLRQLAARAGDTPQLREKLHDLALLLGAYLDWLRQHEIEDGDHLLDLAAAVLQEQNSRGESRLQLAGLWLDGFAEMTPQELGLLAALIPDCESATLAFCLEWAPQEEPSWLSTWSVVSQTFRRCHQHLANLPGVTLKVETLERHSRGRFADNPVLAHLEQYWSRPSPYVLRQSTSTRAGREKADQQPELFQFVEPSFAPSLKAVPLAVSERVRVAACAHPEAEAVAAAREILRHVHGGGRFRDVAVLVRSLDHYHAPLRRVFARYGIPCFLDRREPVAHHLLADLTRNALRVVAFNWRRHDWFCALKTGLVFADETRIDSLENLALEFGWEGKAWLAPLKFTGDEATACELEALRQRLIAPFVELSQALAGPLPPTGAQVAAALRQFWATLEVEKQLAEWSQAESARADPTAGNPVHLTVWQQMNEWLENLERAFAPDAAPLREWLPILEAGLSNLTVGVIPPALDQVLIGAIDRSRNPDLQLALLLGMNEAVFPAPASATLLLTESDRDALENQRVFLGLNLRQRLAHERFYGYIACTRARHRLVLTYSCTDGGGKALNPSPFIAHLQRLFPALQVEVTAAETSWHDAVHPSELIAPLLASEREPQPGLAEFAMLPPFAARLQALRHFRLGRAEDRLGSALAERLYGPVLHTSVSRLEKFAECPFRFFVHSGLRAEERMKFEFDAREAGSFQHRALELFHLRLRAEQRRWHDLTPAEARARMAAIVEELTPQFRAGLLVANDENRFSARSLGRALENFIEIIVGWMPQYEFEPEAAEVNFGGKNPALPEWQVNLGEHHTLAFQGQIDRVDLRRSADGKSALVVVMDYKSSGRKLEPVLMANGVQLQLPAYLNVLHELPEAKALFQVETLTPAGVFYINLRGQFKSGKNRNEVLDDPDDIRKGGYQHIGRFDLAVLAELDNRDSNAGDQFRYKLNKDGKPDARYKDVLDDRGLQQLMRRVEDLLRDMGRRIYAGEVAVDPYRLGAKTPCEFCDYRSICRIDPWEHQYRRLREPEA